MRGTHCNESDTEFLIQYWSKVSENILEWQEVLNKSLTKKALRENYIITLAVTIFSLGRLGRYFYENSADLKKDYLCRLRDIDWTRTNSAWEGRAIHPSGKVLNSEEAIILICSKIKQLIGIQLTKEEEQREKNLVGKKHE